MTDLDPDLLRTFLAFVDGGSLARAAGVVGRTPSAVTAQMQRLEAVIGAPLMEPAGRGRTLTPTGQELVGHARRILSAHREAWLMLKGASASGTVAFGTTQDFADTLIPGVLADVVRTHPRVRLDLRVGRSQELADAFDQGSLDVVLTMRASASLHERHVFTLPMLWLGASTLERGSMELPLALLDPPCGFRVAALSALDQARRPYRIAVASPSLSGLRAAVRAGIAVTARTALMVDRDVIDASEQLGLPPLPQAQFALRARDDASPAVAHLIELMCTELAALPKASGRD